MGGPQGYVQGELPGARPQEGTKKTAETPMAPSWAVHNMVEISVLIYNDGVMMDHGTEELCGS